MVNQVDDAVVELRFNGERFGHWQQVDIHDTVDDLCASVNLSLTRPGQGKPLPLTENTIVDLLIGGVLVSTIRLDLVNRKVGKDTHTIRVTARSLGRELVDCQYSKTLNGLKLGELVKQLCATFKVPVTIVDSNTAVVPNFSMQCEPPSNALINAVRISNLLLYPTPNGGLILTAPTNNPPVATLIYGIHILEYEIVDEYRLRFSEYTVKGYDHEGDKALKGSQKDPGITYFRPMQIMADRHGQGLGGCDRRALLERNRRQARAHRIELKVQGWRYQDENGVRHAWAVNTQVRVVIPDEGVDAVFMIAERTFNEDDKDGHVSTLQVMNRNAFMGDPLHKQKRGAGMKNSKRKVKPKPMLRDDI